MLIDWFTVGAQIVNFLILLVLLKIFLFDRIIRAMDERQQRIRGHLAEAEEKRHEAGQEAEALRHERRELERQREQMLAEAEKKAEEQQSRLEEEARRKVAEQRKQWERQLQDDQRELVRKLKASVAAEVFAVARKILEDLADRRLEGEVAGVLSRRLRSLDEEQREVLRQSLTDHRRVAVVRSVFSLPKDRRREIGAALQEVAGDAVEIRYETGADQILGVELKTPGKKVAWHADQYLQRLEERIVAVVESARRGGHEEERASQPGLAESNEAG